jgi:hypothetical protein
MNPLLEAVGRIWEQRGVRNPVTATPAVVDAFEAKYRVKLSPLVREFFCELNGTEMGYLGMDDEHLIGFWHLDQVRPLSEECPDCVTEERDLFVFADCSIWVHAYAVRLSADDRLTSVFFLGGGAPKALAETFEDFRRGYVRGDERFLSGLP